MMQKTSVFNIKTKSCSIQVHRSIPDALLGGGGGCCFTMAVTRIEEDDS